MKLVALTRFDVRLKADQPAPSADWYCSRIRVFRNVFVPSVASQTMPPDAWIIFVREDSPRWVTREIRRIAPTIDATVVEVETEFGPKSVIDALPKAWWSEHVLVTFRCDNDDGLDQHAIERVARAARRGRQLPYVINMLKGIQCHDGRLYRRLDPSSPFVALVEGPVELELPRTVFTTTHDDLGSQYPIHHLRDAMWWQSLHGQNLGNRSYGLAHRNEFPDRFAHLSSTVYLRRESDLEYGIRYFWTVIRLIVRIVGNTGRWRWMYRSLWGLVRGRS